MIPKKLILGGTCIDECVLQPNDKLDEARKKELDSLIEKIENNTFSNEQLSLKFLKLQKEQYPILDTSFLSMHNTINHKTQEIIQIPRFSVYKKQKEKQGFDDFSVDIQSRHPEFFDYRIHVRINEKSENYLPGIFEKPLLKSIGLYEFIKSNGEFNVPKPIWKKYKKLGIVDFTSKFYGIFPQEIKQKIKKTEPIFENQLFLITETKPEEWTELKLKISKDSLLVGVFENKCYLIDYFNTIPIKNYTNIRL